ncbi:hypothetical protein MI170_27850 [Mycolicibacterium goodii]|uniref:hypothetical protein n=1 Tax=Mycolicibacterium goodii TaxID=134601 RepID=UPI001BDD6AC2|nr:hypothetical protein [Mycolicibacterium goodii]MBU8816907.1 hypothetical protein [Mycolicibacterium goodii]ULN47042.1 hypothetical protein MI170_27850 [Mycolicibacterium goodii]
MSIAGLVRTFGHGRPLTAVRDHLGHEWHAVESAVVVKRRDDLGQRSDLDKVTDPKWTIAVQTLLDCPQHRDPFGARKIDLPLSKA